MEKINRVSILHAEPAREITVLNFVSHTRFVSDAEYALICSTTRTAIHALGKGKGWVHLPVNRRHRGVRICPECRVRERVGKQAYCHPCKIAKNKTYNGKKRIRRGYVRPKRSIFKIKQTRRQYATNLLRRGKVERGPCVFCGGKSRDFHHFDYERCTTNFESVCRPCHAKCHTFLRTGFKILRRLTPLGLKIQFDNLSSEA